MKELRWSCLVLTTRTMTKKKLWWKRRSSRDYPSLFISYIGLSIKLIHKFKAIDLKTIWSYQLLLNGLLVFEIPASLKLKTVSKWFRIKLIRISNNFVGRTLEWLSEAMWIFFIKECLHWKIFDMKKRYKDIRKIANNQNGRIYVEGWSWGGGSKVCWNSLFFIYRIRLHGSKITLSYKSYLLAGLNEKKSYGHCDRLYT